jgi:hypothetical protein
MALTRGSAAIDLRGSLLSDGNHVAPTNRVLKKAVQQPVSLFVDGDAVIVMMESLGRRRG